jgi:streptomycin 6-kinase
MRVDDLDGAFRARMISVFHDDGAAWLERLPSLLDAFAARWRIEVGATFAPLSYAYVAAATRADGQPCVLKASVPRDDLRFEIEAMRHYGGRGAVRLLESDVDAGVMLLERAEPGTPLISLDDDAEATWIAAGVMRALWRPPVDASALPTLADWPWRAFEDMRARHEGGSGELPKALFERAESLWADLLSTQAPAVVLHGDLHHWNIVRAQRAAWLAIDPHGVVGEPAFEVAPYMRNPVADPGNPYETRLLARQPDVRAVLARRLDIFTDALGIDRHRLRDWSIAYAVVSACWSDESHHRHTMEQAVMVAEQLTRL